MSSGDPFGGHPPTTIVGRGAISLARDYILIGGDKSPGQCLIEKCDSPRGWDVRKGYGLSGATLVPTGDEPASVDLSFSLWTQAQIDAWIAFARKYFDESVRIIPGSRLPQFLTVQHPILNGPPLSVAQVVVKDCSELKNDGTGLWQCKVSLLQYRKPTPAPPTPLAAIPGAQAPKPTAKTALQRENAALLVRRNQLAAQAARRRTGQ